MRKTEHKTEPKTKQKTEPGAEQKAERNTIPKPEQHTTRTPGQPETIVRGGRDGEETNRQVIPNRKVQRCRPAVPAEEGSPTAPPCANSEMSGTAGEHPAAEGMQSAVHEQTAIQAGPVPLYLIPQTISSGIHAHGGEISEITVRRTGQHVYAITLTTVPKRKRARKQTPRQGTRQGAVRGAKQAGGDADAD
ncbi:hypothetical protein L1S32_06150 [Methanogenium sp. S4BF]|uniref:hypothetical protein n=1 Tax=Methanogenium sp. S4BF TaxID=1789226 RepID=UPI002417C1BE|nr:hypothetical protein [Methanogenium sp. S4BF]WFN33440.1 hypothetical protein L1S32_06150 [Methanogenium sp. S4BF]